MDEIIKKWIERARYDLRTAEAMHTMQRYLYVAFMCQQSVEKILKAIIIHKGGEVLRTHNLVRLAEIAKVYDKMTEEHQIFLANLTPFAIEARYGDYKRKMSEIIDKKTAGLYLDITKKVFQWLRKQINK